MPLSAKDSNDRIEQLITLTDRLMTMVDKESECLESRQPRAAAQIVEAKAKLAALYDTEMRAIARDKSLIADAKPELKTKLKSRTEEFRSCLDRHGIILGRMRIVTEGMVKAVAEGIARKNQAPSGYGQNGVHGTIPPLRPTTLACNQVI